MCVFAYVSLPLPMQRPHTPQELLIGLCCLCVKWEKQTLGEAAVRGASRSHLVLLLTVWLINRDIGGFVLSGGALTAVVLKSEEHRCLARMGKKKKIFLFIFNCKE